MSWNKHWIWWQKTWVWNPPLLIRQNHFIHSVSKLTDHLLGIPKVRGVPIPWMDELDIVCLTWRGSCRGQSLGMWERAGVFRQLYLAWFGHSTGCPLGSGEGEARLLKSALSLFVKWEVRPRWPLGLLMVPTSSDSHQSIRPWCDWPQDFRTLGCKWIQWHRSVTNMLAAHTMQKELFWLQVYIYTWNMP